MAQFFFAAAKLFSFHVPQFAALPALERQADDLAAFAYPDAGKPLFAIRANDVRYVSFFCRRYGQHSSVPLLLSIITQIKRRLVAIFYENRKIS